MRKISEEEIYLAYPRHVGRAAAIKSIKSAIRRGNSAIFLWNRTMRYAQSPLVAEKRRTSEMTFVPHPSTWFNQDRFYDDELEWGFRPVKKEPDPRADPRMKLIERDIGHALASRWKDADKINYVNRKKQFVKLQLDELLTRQSARDEAQRLGLMEPQHAAGT